MLPGWGKPDMGCIMAVGGAPLVMGWGKGGGTDETSGGDTPRGRGGRGKGGTAGSGVGIGAMGGMPKNIQKKKTATLILVFPDKVSWRLKQRKKL